MIKRSKQFIKKIFNKVDIIENVNLDLTQKQQKCLISYITSSFDYDLEKESVPVTSILEVNQIIKTFIDLNYSIDIAFCLDENAYEKIKEKKYDVIFGFGEVFHQISVKYPDAKRILYVTEHHPKFSKIKETERVEYFFERHGKKIKLSRSGQYYKNSYFNYIDDAVILGEVFPYNFSDFNIHSISPTGFYNSNYRYIDRNLESSKSNFLWFGSNGAIHKGLDLLIDIFSKRDDINLHICGLNKNDRKIFKNYQQKNIYDYGRIDVQGDQFLELVNKCSFVLLPSCSEAMSTSVLTCMRHSMIPIIMRDAGFNKLGDLAFYLEDYKLTYLEKELEEIRQTDNNTIQKMHADIFSFANKEFTLEKFSSDFDNILKKILNHD